MRVNPLKTFVAALSLYLLWLFFHPAWTPESENSIYSRVMNAYAWPIGAGLETCYDNSNCRKVLVGWLGFGPHEAPSTIGQALLVLQTWLAIHLGCVAWRGRRSLAAPTTHSI